jgi:lipopolysaccharide biosynthesis glycosyltransferase
MTGYAAVKSAFVYVTDRSGYELAQHSAMSLVLSQPAPCAVQIFCYQFTPSPIAGFSELLAARGAILTVSPISNLAVEHHTTFGHVTTPTLLKLSAVAKLIRDYDRIIYLDNDILVFDDLKLGEVELGKYPIAAVIDMDLSATGVLRDTKWAAAGGKSENVGGYFNAGFMIFASENWQADSFLKDYAAALDEHELNCPYKLNCTSIDQCALNQTFERRWLKLPPSYNMQAGAKFTVSWKTAAVRHYCGNRKFVPVAAFRNDRRDTRHLNDIRRALGQPLILWPFLYEIPFRANTMRKYRSDALMRRFLRDLRRDPAPGRAQRLHDIPDSGWS